jgi:hypothetical protein
LQDADARLTTDLGGQQEVTQARLWHGQVLVDWDPDPRAGDCLFRPDLLRELRATITTHDQDIRMEAKGHAVAALSAEHAALVRRLGGARRIALTLTLRFQGNTYLGGDETYWLVERGQRSPLLRLSAEVQLRQARAASPHTSPAHS